MGKRIENDKHTFLYLLFDGRICICVCVILLMVAIECNGNVQIHSLRCNLFTIYLCVFLLFVVFVDFLFSTFFPFILCVYSVHNIAHSTIEANTEWKQQQVSILNAIASCALQPFQFDFSHWTMHAFCSFFFSYWWPFWPDKQATGQQLTGLIFTDQFNAIFFSVDP